MKLSFFVKQCPIILFFLCYLVNPNALAMDLFSAYKLAEESDPTVLAAKYQFMATQEKIPQARANFLPIITGQMNLTTNHSTDPFIGHYPGTTYTLNLTQSVLNFDFWNKWVKSNLQAREAAATYNAALQNLIVRVAERYFDILRTFDSLRFAQIKRKSMAKVLEQSKQRFKVGLNSITTVKTDQAKMDIAISDEIAAEKEYLKSKEVLREIIGTTISSISLLKEDFGLPSPAPLDITAWVRSAHEKNFALQAAFYKSKSAFQDIRIAEAAHLPSLNVVSNVSRATGVPPVQPSTQMTTLSSVGMQVNMPLFAGGSVLSKTREAVNLYESTDQDLEGKRRDIESKTRQSYHNVINQISQIEALKHATDSNKLALQGTTEAFRVRLKTSVDVMNAESEYIKTQQDHALARYNYILESLRLKEAAGILTYKDLEYINRWLVAHHQDEA